MTANPKRRRPLYATATRPILKRRRPLYATATRPILKRRRPLYATATTQILNLSNLLKSSDIKRTSRRTVLLKGSDIKRTSRRTALLKGRNTRTIQLPLMHLKGIGIGMTPLSDWLNVLPRGRMGHRTTTTTQRLRYVMAYCIALALKSYRNMCMYSTHVRDLHTFTSHVKHANCCVQSFVTCLLNIGV